MRLELVIGGEGGMKDDRQMQPCREAGAIELG